MAELDKIITAVKHSEYFVVVKIESYLVTYAEKWDSKFFMVSMLP